MAQEMKQAAFKAFASLAANDEEIRKKVHYVWLFLNTFKIILFKENSFKNISCWISNI